MKSSAPPTARSLGSYTLLRELTCSGASRMHLALAPDGRSQVLIKRPSEQPGSRARIFREGRVGLGLRVPQLVRVYELRDEPELFVVMEHVEGMRLSELLARARGDVLRFVAPVLLDTLRALHVLHHWHDEAGAPAFLVHQAPHAGHMLVGVDGVTRLIDLSHVRGRLVGELPAGASTLREAELAPEQRARAALDPRCDLYIVGRVLEDALARSDAPPRGLIDVCRGATAPRRSERTWSADELGYALHHAAHEAGLLATPEELGAWVRALREGAVPERASGGPVPRPAAPRPAQEPAPPPLEAARSHRERARRAPVRARGVVVHAALGVALGTLVVLALHLLEPRAVPVAAAPPRSMPLPSKPSPLAPTPPPAQLGPPAVAAIAPVSSARGRKARARRAAPPVSPVAPKRRSSDAPLPPQDEEPMQLYAPEVLFYDSETDSEPTRDVPDNPY